MSSSLVIRGGSWSLSPVLALEDCRDSNHSGNRHHTVGFRVVEDVKDDYPYLSVRGGSWYYVQGSARPSYRGRNYPVSRTGTVGFRVVEERQHER